MGLKNTISFHWNIVTERLKTWQLGEEEMTVLI